MICFVATWSPSLSLAGSLSETGCVPHPLKYQRDIVEGKEAQNEIPVTFSAFNVDIFEVI